MTTQFPSPKVIFNVIDLSAFALNLSNTSGACCIRARKGPVEPTFISSLKMYKKLYTISGKFEPDLIEHMGMAFFLNKIGASAWIQRVIPDDALYGGVVLMDGDATGANHVLSAGVASPAAYTFNADECLLITGANPGAWNNNLSVIVTNDTTTDKERVTVSVYETINGISLLQESHICSLVPGALDGLGRTIYIENVFEDSNFVRIRHNASSTAVNTKDQATALVFDEGDDGTALSDSDLASAYDVFLDTDTYKIAYFIQNGIGGTTVQIALSTLCDGRLDCIALFDVPEEEDTVADLIAYRNTTLAVDSSRCYLYGNWPTEPDYDNDRQVNIPPSAVVAGLIATSDYNRGPFLSVWGFPDGVINALGLSTIYNEADQDQLSPAGINIFRKFPGRYALWDDRSLQIENTALSYMNVRRTVDAIRLSLRTLALNYLAKPLVTATQKSIVLAFEDYMVTVKRGNGVSAYRIVSDPLSDPNGNNPPNNISNGILTIDVLFIPVKSIRGILINATITRDGVNLNEVGTVSASAVTG